MAELIESAPLRGKYAWDKWTQMGWDEKRQQSGNIKIWKISPTHPAGNDQNSGDFECTATNFRTLAYRWAKRNGWRLHTSLDPRGQWVTIQFYRQDKQPKEKTEVKTPEPPVKHEAFEDDPELGDAFKSVMSRLSRED